MADKKFGQKRVCPHCEKKFYDLNKKSPYKCPCGEKDIVIEEDLSVQVTQPIQQPTKTEPKDEYADIENADSTADADDDSVISLDDAALEEEQDTKN